QQTGATASAADPSARGFLHGASPERYATYRLRIYTQRRSGYDGLVIPSIGSALALWVNGNKLGQAGQVAGSAAEEVPATGGISILFPQAGERLDLVLQVSDFHHASAGSVRAPILFGSASSIGSYEATAGGIELATVILLAVFAVLALLRLLTLQRSSPGRRVALFTATLCAAAVVRMLSISGVPGLTTASPLVGGLDWIWAARLEIFGFLLLYAGYLATFLAQPNNRTIATLLRVLLALSLLSAVGSLLVPIATYTLLALVAGSVFELGMLLLFVSLFIPALRDGATTGRTVEIVAAGVLVAVGVNDLLVFIGIWPLGYLGPFGVAIYAILTWLAESRTAGLPAAILSGNGIVDSEDIEVFGAELRRPLHGIVGLAESMLSGRMGVLDDEQIVSLSLIAASGLRMSNEVDDLVDRERLYRGVVELELTSVAIEPIVERVLEYVKPLMLVRSIVLVNELPRDLPPVQADRRRLEQVFYNLMTQGLHRVEKGLIAISAEIVAETVEVHLDSRSAVPSEREAGDSSPISETHNASGEPPEAQKGRSEAGAGRLSLEVASELIRLHGGTLVDNSDSDEGSYHMSFALPKAMAAESDPEISEQLIQLDQVSGVAPFSSPEPEAPVRGGFRILVGDDDLVSLQTMKNFLQGEHYRVIPAVDGEEVMKQIEASLPDLILLDANLPKIDGIEICRRLRKRYASSELPILILVDKEQQGTSLVEGMTAGASDFISKPIVPDEFQARIKTHINLAKMNTLYSRFVPVELLHFLGHDNVIELQLGDQIQREMTILFVDIRAFTNLSEGMTPEENFKFINSYLARITPIIRENNGFIDKYIGDAILALYPGSPEDALRSAIRMVEYLAEYNGYRKNSGYRAINIGIGIHTGNLIVGIIGDTDRMQGTVISDAVNLASRVQDVTKLYGANIIISQDTFIRLENPTAYNFRFLGKVKVKGKAQSVSLFEVFDGETPERIAVKGRTKQDFEDAILRFSQRKFADASEAFRKIVQQNPNDRAAALFLNRAELFLKREKASWLLK
ncbi:MAG TPA: adenylate/guanylate cyclase domain-containing protein, partial [Spirochaetia bacterium]|nr:adenylate/guanylate cyclase domain-containing protein [Spirochaetia bacterium]